MPPTFLDYMKQRNDPEPSREVRHCPDCRETLPPGTVFCGYCGPPNPAEENPEKGLTLFQTLLRIFLILLLFGMVAVYKLDIPLGEAPVEETLDPGAPHEAVLTPPPVDRPKDADFKVVHTVKASSVNVRINPDTGSEVLAVLEKDAVVNVIENGDLWSKVVVDGKTGYVASNLLGSEIR